MEIPSLEDVNGKQLFERANDLYARKDYTKALEVLEDLSFIQGNDKTLVQGTIFKDLAERTENADVKFTYLLASLECFLVNIDSVAFAASAFFSLAQQLGSVLYYKKSIGKAKEGLSVYQSEKPELVKDEMEGMKYIIKTAESRIVESKPRVGSPVKNHEQKFRESKQNEGTRKSDSDLAKRLSSYWASLNVEIKRNFMKVSTSELTSYVERLYGSEGQDALEQVLASAREDRKWRFWMCRTCSKKFSSSEECKNHLEQEHDAEFKPHLTKAMPQRISKVWVRKISVGGWQPVDAVAAVEMIKNCLEDVKAFAYENGWSSDWPLAADEERSKLLKEIQSLLVSFCDLKILSCSIRDWMMQFPVKHLEKLEVSKHTLTDCHLVETPQSICFLECRELNQILDLLRNVKCERDDGTDHVCRAVDSFCNGTRVKEKIDFDPQFLFLLLDKRLLQCKIARCDDEGIINFLDPNVHYAKAHAHGDDILFWLTDNLSGDESFRFPRPIRTHNLDIWVAVLRAIQFMCRTLHIKYAKKLVVLCYDGVLISANNFCISEDERRSNIPEDQWSTYASFISDECEKHSTDTEDSLAKRLYLSALRDVLEGASYPTFDFPSSESSLNVIRECKNVSDDIVLNSIDLLKLALTNKVPLIDSKILLIESLRINLLNDLTRLSVFDYRLYILRPLKELLLDGIVDMESKAKVAATEAYFLLEKEKISKSKKKKNKSNKKTSTSMPSPIDKTSEHEHSVNLELEGTSPSLKKMEEEEAIKDMQSVPGEDSLSEHLESAHEEAATRYNPALDMALKALLNIKVLQEDLVHYPQPFHDNLEDQVPCALQDFFSAFVSKQIKEEGLYSYLISNLHASLEEVHSMSNDAAVVVFAILELWHYWKSPEIESLVNRKPVIGLFMLEEYEKMSCKKCRRKPNYPEQSYYGIVMAADSIRDLKCAFRNIKFEDILKMNRVEDKMLCDSKTGGCGKTNFVHHIISRCPPIFTIVLEWEKDETEKEISETAKALDWEIDISTLYEGLEPNTKYRLVSMIGCGDDEEQICIAYKKNRWVSLRHEGLAEEAVGNWKSVVRFCGERKVRPEILFYEAT